MIVEDRPLTGFTWGVQSGVYVARCDACTEHILASDLAELCREAAHHSTAECPAIAIEEGVCPWH